MQISAIFRNGPLLAIAALCLGLGVRSDTTSHPASRMASLPQLTLWAWERPEDLRSVDTQKYAIAYLDRTLTIGLNVHNQPRRDPLIFSASAVRVPVIRIETTPHAVLDEITHAQALRAILSSAQQPGIAALQIDFDATRSQRTFYRALLLDLRRQLPANLPLSITALASWCSYDDWLRSLPIDEAVPMFFRMEPDRLRASATLPEFQIREPLCRSSAGVSTTEAWPKNLTGKRIYLFPDNGWQQESLASLERKLP